MCKYGLLHLVASAIGVLPAALRVQLRFVDCFNKRKKEGQTASRCSTDMQLFKHISIRNEKILQLSVNSRTDLRLRGHLKSATERSSYQHSRQTYTAKNFRASTDILWRVLHMRFCP